MSQLRYIIYCRKSSESEDRQIISLESQLIELRKIAEKLHLTIVDTIQESKSAKAPGRPLFASMMKKIQRGQGDGILCWKLDRLARNPIDGGQIIWMIQKRVIKHIQTFDKDYSPEDNVLVMNVEFGMANQFIIDLSKNVTRGLRTKAEKGWLPNMAPLGYRNDRSRGKGAGTIMKDTERYDLVKRMWDMMLSGLSSPPRILTMAVNDWGLTTFRGKKPVRSSIYRLFANPFYYGSFEFPDGSGLWHQGAHEPMITQEEFERVQILLGRKGRPRSKKHSFPFAGILSCGECGGKVTTEVKNQIICSACRHKFSSNGRQLCPKCETPIENMLRPTILRYTYYHCTKNVHPRCSQRSVEAKILESHIKERLSQIKVSERFSKWAINNLHDADVKDFESDRILRGSQEMTYEQCLKKIANLSQLMISPHNVDGSLLSQEEYAQQRAKLLGEKSHLEGALNPSRESALQRRETIEEIFDLSVYGPYWFSNGSPEEKTALLQSVGSNLTIKDKKLCISLSEPFQTIESIVMGVPAAGDSFEPEKHGLTEGQMRDFYARSRIVCAGLHDVRTWLKNNMYFHIFKPPLVKIRSGAA